MEDSQNNVIPVTIMSTLNDVLDDFTVNSTTNHEHPAEDKTKSQLDVKLCREIDISQPDPIHETRATDMAILDTFARHEWEIKRTDRVLLREQELEERTSRKWKVAQSRGKVREYHLKEEDIKRTIRKNLAVTDANSKVEGIQIAREQKQRLDAENLLAFAPDNHSLTKTEENELLKRYSERKQNESLAANGLPDPKFKPVRDVIFDKKESRTVEDDLLEKWARNAAERCREARAIKAEENQAKTLRHQTRVQRQREVRREQREKEKQENAAVIARYAHLQRELMHEDIILREEDKRRKQLSSGFSMGGKETESEKDKQKRIDETRKREEQALFMEQLEIRGN